MKISKCPICGSQPGTTTVVYHGGAKSHIYSCNGKDLFDLLTGNKGTPHELLHASSSPKKMTAKRNWNHMVKAYKPEVKP